MKIIHKSILIVFAIVFFGCSNSQNNRSESYESSSAADSVSNPIISSSAAIESGKDSTRQFIRSAELKFKVKSVVKSTYDIEDITLRNDGFVAYTNLSSNTDDVTITPISADSSLETTKFNVTNSITIRVPNTKLDTTLKEISKNIDHLDYRIISAEDVSLQYLSNKLAQQRLAKNQERLTSAIDNKDKKLNESIAGEELLMNKQEQAERAKLSNLSLKDQIKYSTIKLNIYQRQTIKRELIANDKNIDAYEPGFGYKILEAIKSGWNSLETFLLFLMNLWGFFLFAIAIYFLYRKYKHKFK